jgi:hypothetical protein
MIEGATANQPGMIIQLDDYTNDRGQQIGQTAFDRSGSKLHSSGFRIFPAPGPDEKLKRGLRQVRAPVTNVAYDAAFYRSHHSADNLH